VIPEELPPSISITYVVSVVPPRSRGSLQEIPICVFEVDKKVGFYGTPGTVAAMILTVLE
jgi:hypothetical protein